MDMATESLRVAATVDSPGARSACSEYLSFFLGTEEYGIDILKVKEIRSYETPTRIATSPDHILGVVNLRGVIVPIVDLRLKFALEQHEYNDCTAVIVLNLQQRLVGVVVDRVSDVSQLSPDQVKSFPHFNQAIDAAFITGIGTLATSEGERLLILLNIEHLMNRAYMGPGDQSLA